MSKCSPIIGNEGWAIHVFTTKHYNSGYFKIDSTSDLNKRE